MNRGVNVLLVIFLIVLCIKPFAQQVANGGAARKPARKIFKPTVYLGRTDYCGGPIQKKVFDSLLRKGLYAHDSFGNQYKVVSFDFTYAERQLYEDSTGNLEILTDYNSDHCVGDTLSSAVTVDIYDRTKAGDTAFMDHVLVVRYNKNTSQPMPDSTAFLGKGMKFVIIK